MWKNREICISGGQSSENPAFFGTLGPKIWKNVGNCASEGRTSCEKPKEIFSAVGPKMWKNVGNLASEEGTSCENPTSFGSQTL